MVHRAGTAGNEPQLARKQARKRPHSTGSRWEARAGLPESGEGNLAPWLDQLPVLRHQQTPAPRLTRGPPGHIRGDGIICGFQQTAAEPPAWQPSCPQLENPGGRLA